jgi:hypothetical protein
MDRVSFKPHRTITIGQKLGLLDKVSLEACLHIKSSACQKIGPAVTNHIISLGMLRVRCVTVWVAQDAWAEVFGLAGQSIRLQWSVGCFDDVSDNSARLAVFH